MQRLLIVYNPRSSQYVHVKAEVLDHLTKLKGCAIGKFGITKVTFEDNAKRLSKLLQDGDLVIALGGDATAAVAVNAIMNSDKDVTLSVWPYGNFNDLARTLKTSRREDFFKVILRFLDSPSKNIVQLYPLDIIVDGTHWRYASCYVTMGMTAEAVELFDDTKVRQHLQKGHKSSWRSYLHLIGWYFKNHRAKIFVPELKLNGKLYTGRISDYAALSGDSMCRVMKGRGDYRKPKVFMSKVCYLANFFGITKMMLQSIFHHFPGCTTTGDIIEFLNPATIELQAEGEYKVFKRIQKIEVRKGTKCLKVIQG